MSLDYEFIPIDVRIIAHPKADAAGPEAMGLWLWGMAFARLNRLAGVLPRVSVLKAWGGSRNIILAKRLVDAGLWIALEGGDWEIFNFEKKGAGRPKSDRPTASTERVRRFRMKRVSETHETRVTPVSPVTETRVSETSASISLSSSLSSGSSSSGDPRGPRELRPDEPLTDRLRADFESEMLNVPRRDIDAEWRDFVDDRIKRSATFGSHGAVEADWRKWVRRGHAFAAKDRIASQGRRAERQPLGDPNAKWLKTGSDL